MSLLCKYLHPSLLRARRSVLSTCMATLKTEEIKEFEATLPGILDSLVNESKLSKQPEIADWVKKMFNYTLVGGKRARGMYTIATYKTLEDQRNITKDALQLVHTLGWCVEMVHAFLLVMDDVLDRSVTRRGKPCWYRTPGLGDGAILDTSLMYLSITELLEVHFGNTPQYLDILRIFNEGTYMTVMGQHLDFNSCKDISLFTPERLKSIHLYKAAHYTFRMPVRLGMIFVQNIDKNQFESMEEISRDIGYLFQMQDDYLDVYGDEALTGKVGTDIQHGKCSWLAVEALQRCNETQRATFIECYGSDDPSHVKRIKQLYDNLNLPEVYKNEECKLHEQIIRKASALPSKRAMQLFLYLVNTNYNRTQ